MSDQNQRCIEMAEKCAKLEQQVATLELEKAQLFIFHNDIVVPLQTQMQETTNTLKDVAEIVKELKQKDSEREGKAKLIKNISIYSAAVSAMIAIPVGAYKVLLWAVTKINHH